MQQFSEMGVGRVRRAWASRAVALAGGALAVCLGMAIAAGELPSVFGIPVDFILFACTLLGVALFHQYARCVGLSKGFS